MYTQFFGSYLLNKQLITSDQLMEVMHTEQESHIKLGVLAIHAGYMTAEDVEQVHIKQTHIDKKFGEIAVEEGYLTEGQVNELLSRQKPRYLHISQSLVDKGYLTIEQFQNAMLDYQSCHEMIDLDFSDVKQEQINSLIHEFFDFDGIVDETAEVLYSYITLLFNNIVRFVGDDFTPFPIIKIGAYPINRCVSQKISGDFSLHTALDMDEAALLSFASRYVGEEFHERNEYVKASMEDFLNLHNGLFAVNFSNTLDKEVTLDAPFTEEDVLFIPDSPVYYIPIQFPFGAVNVIFVLS